jgi:serine/threonine protein kinase
MAINDLVRFMERVQPSISCSPARYRRDPTKHRATRITGETKLGEGGHGAIYVARSENVDGDESVKFDPLAVVQSVQTKGFTRVDAIYNRHRTGIDLTLPNGEHVPRTADEQSMFAINRSVAEHRIARKCIGIRGMAQLHGQDYFLFPHPADTERSIFNSFLFMGYIPGKPLDELIASGVITPERAMGIAGDVAVTLQEIHNIGVYHRDIKPANIIISNSGPVVTDYGLAMMVGESHYPAFPDDTSDVEDLANEKWSIRLVMGTPANIPPEAVSKELDVKGDLYSLGTVLYECITGKKVARDAKTPFAHMQWLRDYSTDSTFNRQERQRMVDMLRKHKCSDRVAQSIVKQLLHKNPGQRTVPRYLLQAAGTVDYKALLSEAAQVHVVPRESIAETVAAETIVENMIRRDARKPVEVRHTMVEMEQHLGTLYVSPQDLPTIRKYFGTEAHADTIAVPAAQLLTHQLSETRRL